MYIFAIIKGFLYLYYSEGCIGAKIKSMMEKFKFLLKNISGIRPRFKIVEVREEGESIKVIRVN